MVRKAGFGLLALGLAAIAWVAVTLVWGDPITSLYTSHEQHVLARQLDATDQAWAVDPTVQAASARVADVARLRAREAAANAAQLRLRADRYSAALKDGAAFGRIVIGRLHLNMVVVEGTSESDLRKGPGHYNAASGEATGLPGQGRTIAVAGHRTTYLHPFRHIDALRPGDNIYLQMPYGVFRYVVSGHRIVVSTDWSILKPRPFEQLVLSACHPLYSASHRYVVFARLAGEGRSLSARRSRP